MARTEEDLEGASECVRRGVELPPFRLPADAVVVAEELIDKEFMGQTVDVGLPKSCPEPGEREGDLVEPPRVSRDAVTAAESVGLAVPVAPSRN